VQGGIVIDHVSDLQWDRLLADELPTDTSGVVRAHADQCVACASRLRELTAERDAFRLRPPAVYDLRPACTPEQDPPPLPYGTILRLSTGTILRRRVSGPESSGERLDELDGDAERDLVIKALAACRGNQSRAAHMLGITPKTLIHLIRTHNLKHPRPKDVPLKDVPSIRLIRTNNFKHPRPKEVPLKDDPSEEDPS
jgi:hypothetical protein